MELLPNDILAPIIETLRPSNIERVCRRWLVISRKRRSLPKSRKVYTSRIFDFYPNLLACADYVRGDNLEAIFDSRLKVLKLQIDVDVSSMSFVASDHLKSLIFPIIKLYASKGNGRQVELLIYASGPPQFGRIVTAAHLCFDRERITMNDTSTAFIRTSLELWIFHISLSGTVTIQITEGAVSFADLIDLVASCSKPSTIIFDARQPIDIFKIGDVALLTLRQHKVRIWTTYTPSQLLDRLKRSNYHSAFVDLIIQEYRHYLRNRGLIIEDYEEWVSFLFNQENWLCLECPTP